MLRYMTDRARPGLVTFMTSGHETESVYSYNPQNPHPRIFLSALVYLVLLGILLLHCILPQFYVC